MRCRRLLLLLAVCVPLAADEPPLVLTGLDPVLLSEGTERDGDEDLVRAHDGFTYLFESEATRTRFDAEPGRHAVQNGGLCARMGGTTAGVPDLYAVHEGRIYLFGSTDCQRRFQAEPTAYLERVSPRANVDAAARRGGAEWAARALAATGGADAWRAVSAWREHANVGDRSVAQLVDFAGRLRRERTFGPIRVVEVVTPGHAFSESGRGARALRAVQSEALWREARLAPPALLRALARDGLALLPADRGAETLADGRHLRLLEVALGERTATLLLDAASARPAGVRYLGRLFPDSRVGLTTEWWDDWRPAGAVVAPWHRHQQGQPPERALVFVEITPQPPLRWPWRSTRTAAARCGRRAGGRRSRASIRWKTAPGPTPPRSSPAAAPSSSAPAACCGRSIWRPAGRCGIAT